MTSGAAGGPWRSWWLRAQQRAAAKELICGAGSLSLLTVTARAVNESANLMTVLFVRTLCWLPRYVTQWLGSADAP